MAIISGQVRPMIFCVSVLLLSACTTTMQILEHHPKTIRICNDKNSVCDSISVMPSITIVRARKGKETYENDHEFAGKISLAFNNEIPRFLTTHSYGSKLCEVIDSTFEDLKNEFDAFIETAEETRIKRYNFQTKINGTTRFVLLTKILWQYEDVVYLNRFKKMGQVIPELPIRMLVIVIDTKKGSLIYYKNAYWAPNFNMGPDEFEDSHCKFLTKEALNCFVRKNSCNK
jgi:hypothetical protein